jgi:hypothetical protein
MYIDFSVFTSRPTSLLAHVRASMFFLYGIVAYLLKARTVEAEKRPLLGNGPYTRSRGTRCVGCDVMR